MSSTPGEPGKTYQLLFLGDLMLGRLIDALLPTSISRQSPHTDPESAARIVDRHFIPHHVELKSYNYLSPWGTSVDLIRSADLVLANLETALTTSERRWPDKMFNYRSHTENVRCLTEVGMGSGLGRGYVSLANNHTLDWGVEGLEETVKTLEKNGVEYAGAGRSKEEAARPARLRLRGEEGRDVKCWSFSDHPSDWRAVDTFNLIDYTRRGRERIKEQLTAKEQDEGQRKLGLKVVSMHWGPNYRWHPAKEIVDMAHWLIDECGVDVIQGHSSHHVQGVEVYKGKLVVYGCGDFVDDYAVDPRWRNDLSAAWRVTVGQKDGNERLEVRKLEVFPNRIQLFRANLLKRDDEDHEWVERKFRELCNGFGTRVEKDLGHDGQIVVNVQAQV
ncbi:uncharacterized protein Z518_04274 [Rhinocladiella mackenziei CBS 650.93]|uniref:Capsule synthesis protein CapA domain-containing protein n=1 Tax=Rhinocladiella mackenziei CBS 650.93 TaxID=1442369 RepID=A0A0D2IKR0_9EURO|nr:uncharacterized protein Z518_04274 [Rhinocladiella mackenziei CBS 650.93]KIX06299.1 hypothetical protein Z518_04274 [Rhinocladiella mackenziei CBS 650.93]